MSCEPAEQNDAMRSGGKRLCLEGGRVSLAFPALSHCLARDRTSGSTRSVAPVSLICMWTPYSLDLVLHSRGAPVLNGREARGSRPDQRAFRRVENYPTSGL